MMKSTHEIFCSVIIEAHPLLNSLSEDFGQLKSSYQTNNDNELEINDEPESSSISDESDDTYLSDELTDQILTSAQLEKFQSIFNNTEENDEEELKEQIKMESFLNEQDEKAFNLVLQTKICCTKKCLISKIKHESALQSFQTVKSLSKAELNMFLLGLLHGMKRSDKTHHDKTDKKYLTVKYTFDEQEICETAFLHIYSLTIKKWKGIRGHYQLNGFKQIIHGNKRRKSSHALSFETIIHILTFIVNYAKVHGLPSPGIILINNLSILFNKYINQVI